MLVQQFTILVRNWIKIIFHVTSAKMNASELWKSILSHLEQRLTEAEVTTWLRSLSPEFSGDTLVLSAPNIYAKKRIESDYRKQIAELATALNGGEIVVKVRTAASPSSTTRTKPANKRSSPSIQTKKNSKQANLLFGFGELSPEYTFEQHIVGESNQLARAAAQAVSEEPGRREYNPLFLYGSVGVGKTHLMQAAGHGILKNFPNANVGYVQSSIFVQHLATLFSRKDNDTIERFKQTYRELDVLLIDDIHFFGNAQASQQEFLLTFNTLLEGKKQVIITSDKFFHNLPNVEARLRSRFSQGLSIPIKPPELETRMAILETKAELRNIDLTIDVARFLAENIIGSARELEGVINILTANYNLTGEPISISLAKTVLSDFLAERSINLQEIKKQVAHFYGVRIDDLSAPSRKKEFVKARYVAMSLARKLTTLSTIQIGKAFNRDHTSVLNACKKINEVLKKDPMSRNDYQTLCDMLSP